MFTFDEGAAGGAGVGWRTMKPTVLGRVFVGPREFSMRPLLVFGTH